MLVTIIIPCYNEINTLKRILELIQESTPAIQKQIIVVDDASTDGSGELLLSLLENTSLIQKLIIHKKNLGKGAAIRSALQYINGEITIIQDADLEYSPRDYSILIEPIIDGDADVVYGTRFITTHKRRVLFFWHYLGNQFLTFLSNALSNLNLTDMETCYKAFRSSVIKKIIICENRFGFEPEITAKIAKTQCRIFEVGISYKGRTYQDGKKIGWKDGISAIYCIFRYNLFK